MTVNLNVMFTETYPSDLHFVMVYNNKNLETIKLSNQVHYQTSIHMTDYCICIEAFLKVKNLERKQDEKQTCRVKCRDQ